MKCVLLDDLSHLLGAYRLNKSEQSSIIGLPDVGEAAADSTYFCIRQNFHDAELLVGIVQGRRIRILSVDVGDILLNAQDGDYLADYFKITIGIILSGAIPKGDDVVSHMLELSEAAAAASNPLYQAILDYEEKL